MINSNRTGFLLAGAAAGAVAGLLGAGGGMVLVPLLTLLTPVPEDSIFPTSLSVMLPICLISLIVTACTTGIPWADAVPYLIGSTVGGVAAGLWGSKIPVSWLHRFLGILILWGGIRYLWH